MNSDTAKGSFEWLLCPVCSSKTRIKMRSDTELINFPLFCPKCRKETLIHVKKLRFQLSKSQTHRRRADNSQIRNAVIGFFIERHGNL